MIMIFDKAISTIKNNPIGFIGGAAAGWYVAGKYVKLTNPWHKIAVAFVGGIVGTGIEYNIQSFIGMNKTKQEIKS